MKDCNYLFIKNVRDYIKSRFPFVGDKVAVFIGCLSALESAYGRSVIAYENHNYVGMKLASSRLTVAIGENRSHAVYPSWQYSIIDFMYWLQYHGFNQTLCKNLGTFKSKFAKSGYNSSPDYVGKIESIMDSFNNRLFTN